MGPFEHYKRTTAKLDAERDAALDPIKKSINEQIRQTHHKVSKALSQHGFKWHRIAECYFLKKGYRFSTPTFRRPMYSLRQVGELEIRKTGKKKHIVNEWGPDCDPNKVVEEAISLVHMHQFG